MRERVDVRKAAVYSIVMNVLQVAAVIVLAVMLIRAPSRLDMKLYRFMIFVCAVTVCWGALMDIGAALTHVRAKRQADEIEAAYKQMEELNRTLRAQRHDFMNHIQVVYSLIEMDEPQEACDYMDRVYGDIQRVNRALKTDSVAINALLQAKLADCERRGIQMELDIRASWKNLSMPAWEMCRVLGNLIDNAIDAMHETKAPLLVVSLFEDLKACRFEVKNNGPVIPAQTAAHIFTPGFTTKRTGQGMGLFIVQRLMREYGGDIALSSEEGQTVFSGYVPHKKEEIGEKFDTDATNSDAAASNK
ncbi:sensor histidine kinase [Beduinella massiliensis]|uniref:sensor histidine kinase n=1 Tax=Beduinella massiliensis TaxID=1852363 RepID=UPI0031F85DC2